MYCVGVTKLQKELTANRRKVCRPLDCPPAFVVVRACPVKLLVVMKIRRKEGESHAPNLLYQIVCGLLRYIREAKPNVNFFTDKEYSDFRHTLDAEMKRLRRDGIEGMIKRAEPISVEEDEVKTSTRLLEMIKNQ